MAQAKTQRLKWLDTAKGISIFLVVFWHVLLLSKFAHFEPESWYFAINDPLLSIRMPLFFAVSGYVAAHAVSEEWGKYLVKRIVPLLWLYAVWTLVYTIGQSKDASYLITAWWSPELHLWFIWALLTYRLLGKWLANAKVAALVFFAVLSVLFSFDATTPEWVTPIQSRLPRNAVFFLATFWFGRSFVPQIGQHMFACLIGGAAIAAVSYQFDFLPGLSVAGAVAGLALAAIIASYVRPVEQFFEFLGRHSLEIFVIHFAAVAHILGVVALIPMPHVLAVPVTTLIAVLVPVVIRVATDRFVPWLFVPPIAQVQSLLGGRQRASTSRP